MLIWIWTFEPPPENMGMCITINEAMQFNPLRLNDRSSVAPQLFYFKSNGMSGTSAVTTEVKDTDKVNRPRERAASLILCLTVQA